MEIDQSLDENDELLPFRYSITSYGADYPVDGLVQRIRNGDITIPSFQRGYVWSHREASRFIESLLLGLPVPSIFLSKEEESQRLLVIDGQQRLLTLQYFYEGIWPINRREFALRGVVRQFEGKTMRDLANEDRRKLADSIIHAIIVRQEQPSEDSSSIYHIFERLNTSGVSLTPQEIRTAIYHGDFSDLLRHLNETKSWRAIYGPPNKLMRDQELILRFLALYYDSESYRQPMKGFLNSFMSKHRSLSTAESAEMAGIFLNTIETAAEAIGKRAFKLSRVLNAALFDSIMVGIARRLHRGPITSREDLRAKYEGLLANKEYLAVAERATANEENLAARLEKATAAFSDVK